MLTDLTAVTLNASTGYGLIEDAAIIIEDQTIAWVGAKEDQPSKYAMSETSLGGRLVTPGLIDCHTHLVHGGHRAHEFEQRLEGVSYTEIARAGGGILSTVNATRAAREEELLASALRRVDALIAEGVTALEMKSGYGLDQETELKMLRVARQIEAQRPIRVRTSFLGAHAVPK
ncbi:MAG: imidazolonepropionase, partial [Pseudomonadota bacterium]